MQPRREGATKLNRTTGSGTHALPVVPVDAQSDGAFATGRSAGGPFSSYLGEHNGLWAAYAKDPAAREGVASGGVVTSLLRLALREGVVDGVAAAR
ncbi:MAG: coenzyme F420 hydrogenase/dehydrogenase beta subunit N-terminal domain-containing protein, partial [Longimicrobiales bacterium]